jgi:hypothetical protein
MENRIVLGIALCGVLAAAAGCSQELVSDTCSAVPDGIYSDGAGLSYTFASGQPTPGFDCGETPAGCPGSISCSPHGETVYTVAFSHLEDGSVRATMQPQNVVTLLTRSP